jgi:sulfide:quinone oxidoreductase
MKRIVILGAGTAGTIVANKLVQELDMDQWKITVVDQSENHYYQPGFLFIPFGIYSKEDVVRPRRDYLPRGVEFILSAIDVIEPDQNRVKIAKDSRVLPYDFLVIATGSRIVPDETPGLTEDGWRNIFDFYSVDGAAALARICAIGRAAGWCSTWPRCRSSARWRRWSSFSWPTGSSTSTVYAIGWS